MSESVRKHGQAPNNNYQFKRGASQRSKSCDYSSKRYVTMDYSATPLKNQKRTSSYEDIERKLENQLRNHMCKLRHWEYTKFGRQINRKEVNTPKESLTFTILNYNVLAAELLEQHKYLYKHCDERALDWGKRAKRILREVTDTAADIVCFQEVQSEHYDSFFVPQLARLGFEGIFKKRTGDKIDGCAIFYRKSKFTLTNSVSVEYCRPNCRILDRDNIGLIALLAHRPKKPSSNSEEVAASQLCVATTHLLYNPNRHDIKLAQLQLLFAELDKISYKSGNGKSNVYHPTILTGDFNLTPLSSVYQFIVNGTLQYQGLGRGELTPNFRGQALKNELISPLLKITDQCTHLEISEKRLFLVNNSEADTSVVSESFSEASYSFSSGQLSHNLKLQSVYSHFNRFNEPEVTAHQNRYVTVDYIFHNGTDTETSPLRLLSRLRLLTSKEVDDCGYLPSLAAPSDHLPLAATFLLKNNI